MGESVDTKYTVKSLVRSPLLKKTKAKPALFFRKKIFFQAVDQIDII